MIPVFAGKIRKGQLDIRNGGWPEWLNSLEGHWVEVVVRPPRRKRSLPLDRYYRGVILPILVDATGYSPERMHEIVKHKFLVPYGINSLTDLDGRPPERQREFVELCICFAASLGRIVPPPTKVWA